MQAETPHCACLQTYIAFKMLFKYLNHVFLFNFTRVCVSCPLPYCKLLKTNSPHPKGRNTVPWRKLIYWWPPRKHIWYSSSGVVPSHKDSGLSCVACFGQWDTNKHNTSRGLISTCPIGTQLPCKEAQARLLNDDREKSHLFNYPHQDPRYMGEAILDPPVNQWTECSCMSEPFPCS